MSKSFHIAIEAAAKPSVVARSSIADGKNSRKRMRDDQASLIHTNVSLRYAIMKRLLRVPALYQTYQSVGGFFGARVKSIEEYLPLKAGDRVIDIGCGPGYIVKRLPRGIIYTGFDIDRFYIDHARKEFGDLGAFQCRLFDEALAKEFAGADYVTMMGVMHHIADDTLTELLRNIRTVLRPGATLFVLEPCYRPGQRAFAKWLLDNDRGDYIRNEEGYRAILSDTFEKVRMIIREDYARVPYTFVVGLATKTGS